MIRTNFALSVGSRFTTTTRAAEQNARRGPLSRVWIATGNPRQPLACVWMETEIEPGPAGPSRPYRGLYLVRA
jgi:hypothetical protein